MPRRSADCDRLAANEDSAGKYRVVSKRFVEGSSERLEADFSRVCQTVFSSFSLV